MKRLVWLVAAGALVACGDDDESNGGTGGNGGGDRTEIHVINGEDRTFIGQPMTVVVQEPETENDVAYVLVTLQAFEEGETEDGDPTRFTYDLQLRGIDDHLAAGELTSSGLVPHPPDAPGRAKVEVDARDGLPVFGAATDRLTMALSNGWVEGEVIANNEVIASTFNGPFTIRCEAREDDALVEDRDFTSDFCAAFADLRPE